MYHTGIQQQSFVEVGKYNRMFFASFEWVFPLIRRPCSNINLGYRAHDIKRSKRKHNSTIINLNVMMIIDFISKLHLCTILVVVQPEKERKRMWLLWRVEYYPQFPEVWIGTGVNLLTGEVGLQKWCILNNCQDFENIGTAMNSMLNKLFQGNLVRSEHAIPASSDPSFQNLKQSFYRKCPTLFA